MLQKKTGQLQDLGMRYEMQQLHAIAPTLGKPRCRPT